MPSMVRIIRSLSSSSNLLLCDLDLASQERRVTCWQRVDSVSRHTRILYLKCHTASENDKCTSDSENLSFRHIRFHFRNPALPCPTHLSLLWKWYWPIGTSWKRNQTRHLSRLWGLLQTSGKDEDSARVLTVVLILPLSVVRLSRWWRLAKGLAAPQDSR